jgi:hypothetical protein
VTVKTVTACRYGRMHGCEIDSLQRL